MTPSPPATAACAGCVDDDPGASTGCESFHVTGTRDAVAGCFVRLSELGWRFHTEHAEVAPGLWRAWVTRPSRR